jgi:NitT/TauT family transport system permease protein
MQSLSSTTFWADVGMSSLRVWEAFLISTIFAVPLAAVMASSKTAEAVIAPYIEFLRYLPVPALIPLTILIFGVDELAKLALLFIGTSFQMVVVLLDELHSIPQEYRELVSSLGIRGLRSHVWFFREILPRSFDHARVLVGWCWTYVVIAELIAAERGLGHFIKEAQRLTNTPAMYVGIVVMGILGLLTNILFKAAYPRLFPYAKPKRGRA